MTTVDENTAEFYTNSDTKRDSTSSPSPPPGQRRKVIGRHFKFKLIEHLIIIRKVAASKAHIAPYGQVCAKFEDVVEHFNDNPMMSEKVSWKTAQDRHNGLQEFFIMRIT